MTRQEIFDKITSFGFDDRIFFNKNINTGIHLQQNPDEITDLVVFLIGHFGNTPIKYLEVGSASGGTCYVLNKFLNIQNSFIVDNNQHPKHLYRPTVLKDVVHSEFIGNSLSDDAVNFAKSFSPYDLMFIDAGHGYSEIKSDIRNYSLFLKDSGLLVLHDTMAVPDVKRAANEFDPLKWEPSFETKIRFGIRVYSKCEQRC